MTPRRDTDTNQDAKAIARVGMLIWRNPMILAVVAGLVGINIGGVGGTYVSQRSPQDSAAVAQAVAAGMEAANDTLREHGRGIRDVQREIARVQVQADKTDARLDNHLLASVWVRPTRGRAAEARN